MTLKITERLKKERIYFDGAIGTVLQQSGSLAPGNPPEALNLTDSEAVVKMHRSYLEAGSDVISTNTFGAHRLKFENYREIIEKGIECAKKAMCGFENRYIAFSIGPTGRMLKPLGDLDFEDAVQSFSDSIKIAERCGADLIICETLTDSYETKAALLAAKESCPLPVFVTNAYDESGKLMTGAEPRAMVAMLEGLGADAIGINCSFGPDKAEPIAEEYLKYSSVPFIVNPNAGLPTVKNGETVYTTSSSKFSDIMRRIAEKGASVLGGCCGTTPEYIAATIEKTKNIPYEYPSFKEHTLVSSYTHAVEIGKAPILIGERINPTGKKAFKQALRDGDINYILNEAVRQEEKGAHILDVNVGLPEIDEKTMMTEAVKALQGVTDLPLQLDSSSTEALENALRIYNGKPLINSVNGKDEVMDAVFPLVKKYGGTVVALALDENGIPDNADGRIAIAKRIYEKAASYGIAARDIIIDGLAMTISSDNRSALATLETLRRVRDELGGHTILGVSNISFGLPARPNINAAFYTMAMQNGLSAAIINPNSEDMMRAYFSYCALAGLDENCQDYIARYAGQTTAAPAAAKGDLPLQECIRKGLKEQTAAATAALLKTTAPLDVINQELIPALDVVGKGFEKGTVFLPQLLMSAEAAKAAFDVIKQQMADSGVVQEKKGKIILATVKGDIHDIGKNIVKVLLENYSYDVIDLGRDVPPETIVETALAQQVKLVGLSALMTTTVPSMEETIRQLNAADPTIKVMVGGAVLTQEYADTIHADAYCKDAMASVNYAGQVLGRKEGQGV